LNKSTPAIAITGFDDLIDQQIRKFSDAGVSIVLYDPEGAIWKNSLRLELSKYKEICRYDFIIICALEKERAAYQGAECIVSAPINQHGIDCVPIQIGNLKGAIIKPVRMGPIEAAIATSKSIERFRPKLVAMSGICAGFPSEVSLGTLLIPELCWDYQTGKWTDNGFLAEPYAVAIPAQVRSEIATFVAAKGERILGSDLYCDPIRDAGAHMGVFVTGSSVISSVQKMDDVSGQHRKLSGLDMEMTAVFQAASGSIHPLLFFGAKTVVDLGDSKKNDALHTPGSVYSARFVVEMIRKLGSV
jgi:nucleoside phosphorylase